MHLPREQLQTDDGVDDDDEDDQQCDVQQRHHRLQDRVQHDLQAWRKSPAVNTTEHLFLVFLVMGGDNNLHRDRE